MVTTLLGRRYVNVRGADGIITTAPCYLAAYADFYRYPGIDLAVVENPEDRAQFLVNPYSRRLDDVRASRIVAVVARNKPGAIIDLHRLETPANGYVLWGEVTVHAPQAAAAAVESAPRPLGSSERAGWR